MRGGRRKSFAAYLTQDLHYLTAFAESYTAGLGKAVHIDPDAVQVIENLLQGVRDEISDVHANYVKVLRYSRYSCTQ